MALTDGESGVLWDIAAALAREDPRLVSSLRTFTPLRTSTAFLVGVVLVWVIGLLGLAAWLENPAALVLAVTHLVVLPSAVWFARRRGWL